MRQLGQENKDSTECYVTPAFQLYLENSMKASVGYIFGQNLFGSLHGQFAKY